MHLEKYVIWFFQYNFQIKLNGINGCINTVYFCQGYNSGSNHAVSNSLGITSIMGSRINKFLCIRSKIKNYKNKYGQIFCNVD